MIHTAVKINTNGVRGKSSRKAYSPSYQEKLDVAIIEAEKSKKIQSLKDFLIDVRSW